MYRTILHATDLSENHYHLCQKAVTIAEALNASLHFIHVVEIPASLQWAQSLGFAELATPSTEGAQTVMNVLGDAFSLDANHLHVAVGSAYQHILTAVKELNVDLLIIGNHSINAPLFQGSTAQALHHHAICDILTLRADLSESLPLFTP